jgi:regulatory protein
VREKYIDEKRFASAFVKDKFNYNKWGKIRLRLELKAKKIEESIIEGALSEIKEKEYRMMITKLIREKEKHLEYRNEYEKKGKLFRYLSGKGFENEFISKAIGSDM